jgi:secreted protein with Ig-like and vWFA domain
VSLCVRAPFTFKNFEPTNCVKEDKVAIVVYAGAAGQSYLHSLGRPKKAILVGQVQSGGITAGGAGIELAYNTATKISSREITESCGNH